MAPTMCVLKKFQRNTVADLAQTGPPAAVLSAGKNKQQEERKDVTLNCESNLKPLEQWEWLEMWFD